jgi:hypothetical protein
MAIRPKIGYGNLRIPQLLKPPQLPHKDRNKGMEKAFNIHELHIYHSHISLYHGLIISNKIRITDHVIANT